MKTIGGENGITTRKILLEIESTINELFKKQLKSTPLSIFVLDWSLDIIYMNPAFERQTGFRAEDMMMRRVKFSVHPEDREEIESAVIMAIMGWTTQSRCRIHGSNGSFHALALSISPLRCNERCLVLCVETGCDPERDGKPR